MKGQQTTLRVILAFSAAALAYAQTPNSSLSFEVASVKPSPPPQGSMRTQGCFGGPGTRSPGQYVCTDATVAMMVRTAFGLRPYQLPGVSMTDGLTYDVRAPIPAGATQAQLRVMLQNLLIARFGLKYHLEKREMPVYTLVVGKDGPKLKVSPPESASPAGGEPAAPAFPPKRTMGPYGVSVPSLSRGQKSSSTGRNGVKSFSAGAGTMDQLAEDLSNELGRPVTDATGLTGEYDYTLTFLRESATESDSDAPTLLTAVQEQLGLKLEKGRGSVDVIFIDHVEKSPTAN